MAESQISVQDQPSAINKELPVTDEEVQTTEENQDPSCDASSKPEQSPEKQPGDCVICKEPMNNEECEGLMHRYCANLLQKHPGEDQIPEEVQENWRKGLLSESSESSSPEPDHNTLSSPEDVKPVAASEERVQGQPVVPVPNLNNLPPRSSQAVSTMDDPRPFMMVLCYPCSIDSGIDAGKYAERIVMRENPDKSEAELKPKIEEMRKVLEPKFKHTCFKDKTSMEEDSKLLQTMGIHLTVESYFDNGLVTEADDTRIGSLGVFLRCIRPLSILYLMGHGLASKQASKLNATTVDSKFKISEFPWSLDKCQDAFGEKERYSAKGMCKNASKGDLVVFHSGFLTPQWVLEQLEEREKKIEQLEEREKGKMATTVILLLDSCFSGYWVKYLSSRRSCFKSRRSYFKSTRVLIQTACGPKEESYGQYFSPLWVELQKLKSEDIINKVEKVSSWDVSPKQHPCFYDSYRQAGYCEVVPGCAEVNVEGKLFRFFTNATFFLKFAKYYCSSLDLTGKCIPRGAPRNVIDEMLKAFKDNTIEIECFRLKTYKGENETYKGENELSEYCNTPMALVLVYWKGADDSEKLLYLHLHFNAFAPQLELGRISNVGIVPKLKVVIGEFDIIIKYTEDKNDNKDCIDLEKNDSMNVMSKFTSFVSKILKDRDNSWCSDSSKWNMGQALPLPWIRSRSCILKEYCDND